MKTLTRSSIHTAGQGSGAHCHFLIAETAMAMAHELYSMAMRDNKVYAEWKAQCPELTPGILEERFCELLWPRLLEQARATLTKMLSGPYDQVLKTQIADALILDNTLRRGRDKTSGGARLGPARNTGPASKLLS